MFSIIKYKLYIVLLIAFFFLPVNLSNIAYATYYTEKNIIQRGDTLLNALNNNSKLSESDVKLIVKNIQSILNVDQCIPGDFYEIILDSMTNTWKEFAYYPLRNNKEYYLLINDTNQIRIEQKEYEIELSTFYQKGTVTSSLWAEMKLQNIPSDIILAFADIFAWKLDFVTSSKKGDTFQIFYEIEYLNKKNVILSSKILAAQYNTSNKTYNAFYFNNKQYTNDFTELGNYFDETGESLQLAFLKAPLQFSRISSFFSKKRLHPILKYIRPHLGIDYAAPLGTPVSAIGNGIILRLSTHGDFGNLIVIKHLNGYETYYGHLLKFENGLKKGDKVNQGQIIGYVGMTGLATGPHLDFRIKKNGNFLNFLKIKQMSNIILTNEEKQDFYNQIKSIIANFDSN
ncbi:MAG: M23 family metallopeptidase [Endomicrobium sp.]|jgi:murein DD-endopeptidase MepM/ murein hydrolase activator NlpD|nr:M23 family metallopeptidase [Endomicrobium sp.]